MDSRWAGKQAADIKWASKLLISGQVGKLAIGNKATAKLSKYREDNCCSNQYIDL